MLIRNNRRVSLSGDGMAGPKEQSVIAPRLCEKRRAGWLFAIPN